MRMLLAFCGLLITTPLMMSAQSPFIGIPGVHEPPELTGEFKVFARAPVDVDDLPKNQKDAEAEIARLTDVLQQNPDYSEGYFLKALFSRCILNSTDTEGLLKDINTAIATHAGQSFPDSWGSLAASYSLRAKIEFDTGRYKQAMDDLETAIKQNSRSHDIFGESGTKPDAISASPCWSSSDFDDLVQRFPKDYRALLFRGVLMSSFATFNEKHYQEALQQVQRASLLNPQSPLPHYYLGELYGRAAWNVAFSDERAWEEFHRKAILAYGTALRLDSKLLAAYKDRALAYDALLQYRDAIKDYDKAIELDPEDSDAYRLRAEAEMKLQQYSSAIVDFGEAIRWEKRGWGSLLYENLAHCYLKVADYRSAVAALTKAIEMDLESSGLLFTIRQFRELYPEYDGVSDTVFRRKLHDRFWPQDELDRVAKPASTESEAFCCVHLEFLYEDRGDAWLKAGDFRRAVDDFSRIHRVNSTGYPYRWRLLGSRSDGEDYLDVNTVEFPKDGPARLWVTTVKKDKTSTVQSYDIDCKTRRINLTSTAEYNADDHVVGGSERSSGWQRIIPETRGEQLYNGMCQTER